MTNRMIFTRDNRDSIRRMTKSSTSVYDLLTAVANILYDSRHTSDDTIFLL